jgi:hypothetical protein
LPLIIILELFMLNAIIIFLLVAAVAGVGYDIIDILRDGQFWGLFWWGLWIFGDNNLPATGKTDSIDAD